MEKRIVKLAKLAKAQGYKYAISIVKAVYNTEYYNVVSLDVLIEYGYWPACTSGIYQGKNGTWYGPNGWKSSQLPDKCIYRTKLYSLDK